MCLSLPQVCFLAGTLALGATGGHSEKDADSAGSLTSAAREDLQLARDLGHTCYQMYNVMATGLGPEIAYFNEDVRRGNVK